METAFISISKLTSSDEFFLGRFLVQLEETESCAEFLNIKENVHRIVDKSIGNGNQTILRQSQIRRPKRPRWIAPMKQKLPSPINLAMEESPPIEIDNKRQHETSLPTSTSCDNFDMEITPVSETPKIQKSKYACFDNTIAVAEDENSTSIPVEKSESQCLVSTQDLPFKRIDSIGSSM